jgi:6-phosphogluconolactonase
MREFRTGAFSEFETPGAAAAGAARLFSTLAGEAIRQRGRFLVALAGGTSFLVCYRLLSGPTPSLVGSWERTVVFFGDERCVPEGHPDRNDAAADGALLRHVPIPSGNVHRVDATAEDAAERYEAAIRRVVGRPGEAIPSFDLVLLGLGPDGHTASLFPGHPAVDEEQRLVVRVDGAPKRPASRITVTLPLINAARCVAFLVTGPEKAEAFFAAMAGQRNVPAGRVNPLFGQLLFLADRDAASIWRVA